MPLFSRNFLLPLAHLDKVENPQKIELKYKLFFKHNEFWNVSHLELQIFSEIGSMRHLAVNKLLIYNYNFFVLSCFHLESIYIFKIKSLRT